MSNGWVTGFRSPQEVLSNTKNCPARGARRAHISWAPPRAQHGGRCRRSHCILSSCPPGGTGPSCPQRGDFPVPRRKEAKPGWPGDIAVDGTSAWGGEIRPGYSGGRLGRLLCFSPSPAPHSCPPGHCPPGSTEAYFLGGLKAGTPRLGCCPGLGELGYWPGQLLTTPVILSEGLPCRGGARNERAGE